MPVTAVSVYRVKAKNKQSPLRGLHSIIYHCVPLPGAGRPAGAEGKGEPRSGVHGAEGFPLALGGAVTVRSPHPTIPVGDGRAGRPASVEVAEAGQPIPRKGDDPRPTNPPIKNHIKPGSPSRGGGPPEAGRSPPARRAGGRSAAVRRHGDP